MIPLHTMYITYVGVFIYILFCIFFMIFFSVIDGLQCSVSFLLYSKVTQSHIYTHSFSHIILHHSPSQVTGVLYSSISLLIHSKGDSLHLLTPNPHPPHFLLLPLGNHKSLLQVHDFLFCGKLHLCCILDSRYK